MKRSLITLSLMAVSLAAQNPANGSGDVGFLETHGLTGIKYPVGYDFSPIFATYPTLAKPASMVIGSGGHLYFTETVGNGCNPSPSTHVYRVLMNGTAPIQPVTVQTFTSVPIIAHELAYDSITDALYVTGTCSQTSLVYKVPANGVAETLNPSQPLPDPDDLAIGFVPGSTAPHLFVAGTDSLFVADLSQPAPTFLPVSIAMGTTGASTLGNWGFIMWDHMTGTLLGTNVGRPSTHRTVEITFTSATTAVAAVIGPDGVKPQCVDQRGVRYFANLNQIGMLNMTGPGAADFIPVIEDLVGFGALVPTLNEGFFLLDAGSGGVAYLEPALTVDSLNVSTSAGKHVHINLNAPAPRGNEDYLVLTSISGSNPGTPYGPVTIPLNVDLVTEIAGFLATSHDPMTLNWNGTLDANGQASAIWKFPPGIIPAGFTFQLVFICGNPEYTSNATWIHVVP